MSVAHSRRERENQFELPPANSLGASFATNEGKFIAVVISHSFDL